jgi:archaellum biogenesis ATPase FlaH
VQSNIETLILGALIESKEAYEEFERFGNGLDEFSPINRAIAQAVERYRKIDGDCGRVDRALLEEQLLRDIKNDKHIGPIREALRGIPSDVSVGNVREHVRALHKGAVGQRLSLALANGASQDEVSKLIAEYGSGESAGSIAPSDLVDCLDTSDLTADKPNEQFIRLYPKALNDRLDGGALRGNHILVFARPETGKTLFAINAVYGFLVQKLSVLYVGNEEPSADIRDRIRGRLLKISKSQVRSDRTGTASRLTNAQLGSINIAEGTAFSSVREILRRTPADVLVLDQIRNMRLKSDSRTSELEAAGIEARAIAKEFNVLVVSITQAGDSATNKVYLEMSDVDSSKTGIPASADLMVGLGSDEAMKVNNLIGISLPKNKLSGRHDKFTVNCNFQTGEIT